MRPRVLSASFPHFMHALVILGLSVLPLAAEEPSSVLKNLIHARATCAGPDGGALRARYMLSHLDKNSTDEDCVVMIEQPMWANSVIILVYDPASPGKGKVPVEVFEQNPSPGPKDKGLVVFLQEATPNSGIYIGTAEIAGSHSTSVVVRYWTGIKRIPKLSNVESMAFH